MIEYTVREYDEKRDWLIDGLLHRVGGPAVEWKDGSTAWYKNGELHREDGPAVEWAGGSKEWYVNGKRHRLDGPAIEHDNKTKLYYINDYLLTEKEFNSIVEVNGVKCIPISCLHAEDSD